jgi:hypothetical protein
MIFSYIKYQKTIKYLYVQTEVNFVVTSATAAVEVDYSIDDSDGCAGVRCPDITDCPTQPYVPLGECCPICPYKVYSMICRYIDEGVIGSGMGIFLIGGHWPKILPQNSKGAS